MKFSHTRFRRLGSSLWLIALCLSVFTGRAQVANYTFTVSQSPYQPLVPDSVMGTLNSDNNIYNNIELGFPFLFNGKSYEKVSINWDGFVNFNPTTLTTIESMVVTGGTPAGSRFFNPAATYPTDQYPGVAALIADFGARGRANNLIGIKRGGAAPNRFFTVEWRNMRRWTATASANAAADSINFQVTYFESSNDIEIHYGKVELGGPATLNQLTNVGLRGDSLNQFISLASTTDWNALSRTQNRAEGLPFAVGKLPSNGMKIRFSRFPTIAKDLGVLAVASPRPDQVYCILSNQEAIRLAITNYGSQGQDSVAVAYRVNNSPVVRQKFALVPALAPGRTTTVSFTGAQGANLSTPAVYTITAYTEVPGEPAANRANDTTQFSFTLSGPLVAPPTPITDLATSVTRNWTEGRGRTTPTGRISNWVSSAPFATPTIGITFTRNPTTQVHNEWLISPAYQVAPTSALIFKAGVTKNTSGLTPIRFIGDDTVKVVYSTDCGNTWRTLRSFTQADVTAGALANRLQEFRILVGNLGASNLRLGFYATNNATGNDSTYRFHLDDIEVKEVLATDMGVSSVVSPRSGAPGCLLGSAERVTVTVSNYGSLPQRTFRAGYKLGNNPAVTEDFTLPQPLQPGGTANITFSAANTVDLSQAGKQVFVAWTVLTGETPLSNRNDTVKADSIRISAPLALPSPRITDVNVARNPGLFGFGRGIDEPAGGISSWGFGSINGTVIAVTMSAAATANQREWIYSPTYAVSPATQVLFKVGIAATSANPAPASGMDDDTLYIKTSSDCGNTWKTLKKFSQADVASGALGFQLTQYAIYLPTGGDRLSVAFFADGQGTPAPTGYRLFIDDIQVKNALAFDAGITAMTAPISNLTGCAAPGLTAPRFTLRNYGTAPLDSVTVGYRVDQGAQVRQRFTLNPVLPPGESRSLQFDSLLGADLRTPGTYRISTFALYPGEDPDGRANDSVKNVVYTVSATQAPTATDDFDSYPFNQFYPTGWRSEGAPADFRLEPVNGVDGTTYVSARMLPSNPTSYIVTPRYALDATSVALQFFSRIREIGRGATVLAAGDSMMVEISTDCAEHWTILYLETAGNQPLNDDYTPKVVSLTPYHNKEASFRIRARIAREPGDQSGCRIDIDNWRIGTPNGVRASVSAPSYLFPNPTSGLLRLNSLEPAQYVIRSLQGQVLQQGAVEAGGMISVAGLAKGLYLAELTTRAGVLTVRFVRQ